MMWSSSVGRVVVTRFPNVMKSSKLSTAVTPFYRGVHGERTFNDEHPVLAVLAFCTIFSAGAGTFHAMRLSFDWLLASPVRQSNVSFEFNDVSDSEN